LSKGSNSNKSGDCGNQDGCGSGGIQKIKSLFHYNNKANILTRIEDVEEATQITEINNNLNKIEQRKTNLLEF